jgi:hypothetical protein
VLAFFECATHGATIAQIAYRGDREGVLEMSAESLLGVVIKVPPEAVVPIIAGLLAGSKK